MPTRYTGLVKMQNKHTQKTNGCQREQKDENKR